MIHDWSKAPEWAHYVAVDGSGISYWHETCPSWDIEACEWISDGEVRKANDPEMSIERRP